MSVDQRRWFLINASPDLRSQLISFPVQPSSGQRQTPLEAVLLTDADLDHVLGLFLLRESNSEISVGASKAIRRAVEEGFALTEVLAQYCGIRWAEVPLKFKPLLYRDGAPSGLEYKGLEIQGPSPRYARRTSQIAPTLPRLVYVFRELTTTRSVLVAPVVAILDPQLLVELWQADAVFFDGTFWSNDDFQQSGIEHPSVAELLEGHLPISNGSLTTLAGIPATQKTYLHINNTNPILWNDSPERKRLDDLGIKVAWDGMEIEL